MADAWLGINSSHIDGGVGVGYCGEFNTDYGPDDAFDETAYWFHNVDEVHWLILDLGETYRIKKFRSRSSTDDDPIDVDIYVSDDKGDWGVAVATGINTWQDSPDPYDWIEVDTTDKDGRYIKIVINDTEDLARTLGWGAFPAFSILDVYGSIPVAVGGQPYTSRVQGVQGMRSWGGI